MLQYEWDPVKAAANLEKHRVSFPQATEVFLDPLAATYSDPDHSLGEHRYITIGHDLGGHILFVSHQELDEHRIRVISARHATKRESHAYKEAL